MAGWVLFRVENLAAAQTFFGALAGFAEGSSLVRPLPLYATPDRWLALGFGAVFALPLLPALRAYTGQSKWPPAGLQLASLAGYLAVFYACAVCLSAQTYNPFIYFRF